MEKTTKFEIKDLDLYYGSFQALKKINLDIREREITAFIGPSGCGKSTLIKTLNRMNDLVAVSYTHLIVALRRRLHRIHRYYDQLEEVIEALADSEGGVVDEREAGRFAALARSVRHLGSCLLYTSRCV